MKLVVLVKQVPDTSEERHLDISSGLVDRAAAEAVIDEIDERALEVALRWKDGHKGDEVVALTMGPAGARDALRKALAMGADSAVHLEDEDFAGADALTTARVIATALRTLDVDLVLAGNESTDGRGGVVPAMVAELLGLPFVGPLDAVDLDEASVSGDRATPEGVQRIRASLPAVAAVTERSAEARFPSFKGIMTAKRKPVQTLSLSDLDLGPDLGGPRSIVLSAGQRPARAGGRTVVDDGTAATQLAEFLAAEHLV